MAALPSGAVASPVPLAPGLNGEAHGRRASDLPSPLETKRRSLRNQALQSKLAGKPVGKVQEVAKGQFVELERKGEDAIWTILGEFNDLHHNSIAMPDRATDTATIWQPDFNRDYFMEILFSDTPGI